MTKQAIKEYIMENLRVKVSRGSIGLANNEIEICLELEGKEFGEASIFIEENNEY